MVEAEGDTEAGAGLVRVVRVGTGVLVATSAAAALLPTVFGIVHAGVSLLFFAAGIGAFLWAYALGVTRSRTDLVDIPGLFLLAGDVAPDSTRRELRIAVIVEVVAVVAAASIRPFSEVAFGILAPTFGLGLMAMWSARHGTFPPRPPKGLVTDPGPGPNPPAAPM